MAATPIRVVDALDQYLTYRRARYAGTTVANEEFVLRRFVHHVGDIQVRHLRPEHVTDWFYGVGGFCNTHVTRDGIHREPVKPSTHNFYRTRLASFFRFGVTRGWIKQDLLRDIEPWKVPVVKRLQPPPHVLLAMLDVAANDRDRAYIAMAINSGLRANEIVRIRIGDVDLDEGVVRVTISKTSEEDVFPVTADLDGELRRWILCYQRDVGRPLTGDDHLFPARRGGMYRWYKTPDGSKERRRTEPSWDPSRPMSHPERCVQHALRSVGVPTKGEGTHTIRRAVARHFFDSMSSEVGYDAALRTVSAMLHHKSSATTEHYLGLSSERERRDQRLRGQPFLTAMVASDNVTLLRPRDETA
jgi:integrase